jgi:aminoglycoside 3-N-acetyltransferase I
MGYSYKLLGAADILALKELNKVFGDAFGDASTYEQNIPSDEYLHLLLSKPHFIALAALDVNGEVVGGLAAYELEKFEEERREIFIYDLAVAENHRRKGIAGRLIYELKEIAKKRNAYLIFVQAGEGDEAAASLYESFGAKESTFNFDIPIGK